MPSLPFHRPSRRSFFSGAATASLGLILPRAISAARGPAEGGPAASGPASAPARPESWHTQVSPEARLRELDIELPSAPRPVATYVPAVVVGNVLYVAGHTPRTPDGGAGFIGTVGDDYSIEQGQAAARQSGLNILATVRNALGSLDRVERLVRTFGMVNAAADFSEQPQVINGFSDLMVDIFGQDAGTGTRAAVGMGSLPGGMAVEIETFWLIRE